MENGLSVKKHNPKLIIILLIIIKITLIILLVILIKITMFICLKMMKILMKNTYLRIID